MTNDQKELKRVASLINSRFITLQQTHQQVFDDADAFYQMYRSAMEADDSYPWDYQLTDPQIFYLIRNIMSKLNPERMKIDLSPTSDKSIETRNKNMKILEWEFREINKTVLFYKSMWTGLIKGRCYLETGWKYQPALEMQTDTGNKVFRDITNRADVTNVRFEDIYVPNPNEPDIEKQPFILQRVCMTYGEMLSDNEIAEEKGEGEYWDKKLLEKIKKQKLFAKDLDYGDDFMEEDEKAEDFKKSKCYIESQVVKMIKMMTNEKWYYVLEDFTITEILNKKTDNKYWHGHYPIISWTPFPEEGKYYSLGIVQPLADLCIASSSVLNQYLTNSRKAGNPMWIAGAEASQTPEWQFVHRPDGIIRVAGDVNQVRQMTTIDTGNTMLAMRAHLSQAFEKSASMSSLYTSGVGEGAGGINKTAGGARIISANIDANVQLLLSLFASQLLTKIGEHFLELNAQFITEEQSIKITGQNAHGFITVAPEEISANFDVYVNPYTIEKVTPQVKQAALINLKMTIDKEQQVKIDKTPIWRSLFNSYPEIEGMDDIVLDPKAQSDAAIEALLKGVMPEINQSVDYKAVRQYVQLYMIDKQDMLSDEQIMFFSEYIDKLTNWMKTQQQLFTAELPQQEMMPTNMEDLEMAMAERGTLDGPQNPVNIPQDQLM
jgi:hypothetical protein